MHTALWMLSLFGLGLASMALCYLFMMGCDRI